jgi:L-histidine Nalpha-methyltransferase
LSFESNSEKFETLVESFQRTSLSEKLAIISLENPVITGDFAEDVRRGLTSNPKYLFPKYFYDSKGSELFEEITRLKEYYPTEVERSIIKSISKTLPLLNSNISTIVEIGSGSSNKTRHIIESFSAARDNVYYAPLDISDIIIESSKNLLKQFENISIEGIISEYENGLEIASEINHEPKLYLFLGSSIGNFTHDESISFLNNLSSIMKKDDRLLIGFDRIKDREVLQNAYDDSKGITAKFNLNILDRINFELNADFNLSSFDHFAKFNEEKSRIEMHLVSQKRQTVNIEDLDVQINFEAGETIHTENSYKYTQTMINNLADESGFEIVENFTDSLNYFSMCLFKTA